jgi:hypothetical protein
MFPYYFRHFFKGNYDSKTEKRAEINPNRITLSHQKQPKNKKERHTKKEQKRIQQKATEF